MPSIGLVGPSYTSQAVNAACQKTENWYPEKIEVQDKVQLGMYPCPGLRVFAELAGEVQVPGLFEFNGRAFAAGQNLWELFSNGTVINRGSLNNTSAIPTSFAANQANQLLVAAGGNLWVFDLLTNVLTAVDMSQLAGPVDQVGFVDTYFVSLIRNSNTFHLSDLLDGTSWPGLNASQVSVFPENIVSMIVAFREVWFLGQKQSTAYQDTGDPNFPFAPIPSAFMEQGCGAQWATTRLDNTGFWLSQNEAGARMAWRADGYRPQRISTHAVETAMAGYPRIDDVIGYAYQERGHVFWVLYFPSAHKTWVYDAATNMWHERPFWDSGTGLSMAHRSRCHCYAFGKHLVGDWKTGTIYEMSSDILDDFGNPIRRVRRAQHISAEQQWVFHRQLQIDLETGLGPTPPLSGNDLPSTIVLADSSGQLWSIQIDDGGTLNQTAISTGTAESLILNDPTNAASWEVGITTGGLLTTTLITTSDYPGAIELVSVSGGKRFNLQVSLVGLLQAIEQGTVTRGPELILRWSDDGGHVWSNQYTMDAGQAGEYTKRCIRRRLGRSRSRVYEISCSDPVPWRILDAYLMTA